MPSVPISHKVEESPPAFKEKRTRLLSGEKRKPNGIPERQLGGARQCQPPLLEQIRTISESQLAAVA